MEMVVVLDNVRSAHNVGAIFRTADGAGVSKIFLCGYTPTPIDRFGRVQPEIEKTALGATQSVEWEAVEHSEAVLNRLHEEGFSIAAIEQHRQSIPYKNWNPPEKVAFIFGNEIVGVEETALKCANVILEIPLVGHKESLNVSTTVGIVLFHFR